VDPPTPEPPPDFPPTHAICDNGQCRVVHGNGSDECEPGDPYACRHLECIDMACAIIPTPGKDQCTSAGDCIDWRCSNEHCLPFPAAIPGKGTRYCESDLACTPCGESHEKATWPYDFGDISDARPNPEDYCLKTSSQPLSDYHYLSATLIIGCVFKAPENEHNCDPNHPDYGINAGPLYVPLSRFGYSPDAVEGNIEDRINADLEDPDLVSDICGPEACAAHFGKLAEVKMCIRCNVDLVPDV